MNFLFIIASTVFNIAIMYGRYLTMIDCT